MVWGYFVWSVYIYLIIVIDSLYLSTGVSSYKVDLNTKMVVVIGDIIPLEVLQSVSKVKNAQLWNSKC